MKNKKTSILLICTLTLTLILSVQYLKLKRDYNNLLDVVKDDLATNLIQSRSIGYGIDLNKITSGDKKSILSLINMYEYISNSNAILMVSRNSNATVLDPLTLDMYKIALRDIVAKSINGKLEPVDTNKLKIITEDVKLIYKYVTENDKLNYNEFYKEVQSKLKLESSL